MSKLGGYSFIPMIGDASSEPEQVQEKAQAETVRVEKLREYETDHLCLTCVHRLICHVVAAIKQIDGEGDIVISSCGAFEMPQPSIADLLAAADGGDEALAESAEDVVKDRR